MCACKRSTNAVLKAYAARMWTSKHNMMMVVANDKLRWEPGAPTQNSMGRSVSFAMICLFHFFGECKNNCPLRSDAMTQGGLWASCLDGFPSGWCEDNTKFLNRGDS